MNFQCYLVQGIVNSFKHLFLVLSLIPFTLIDEMERRLNKLTFFSDDTNIKLTDKLLGGFRPFQEAVDMRSLRVHSSIGEKERDHQGLVRERKLREVSRFNMKLGGGGLSRAFSEKCLLFHQPCHFAQRDKKFSTFSEV